MPVRSTMANLIARTRLFLADPAGTSQQFTDQDIQDKLDEQRDEIRYELLTPVPTLVNSGDTADWYWGEYVSAFPFWEQGEVLSGNPAFATITPATSDELTGRWTFTTGAPGQLPPVFATGFVYDVYAATADLLEMWASTLARAYDFTADGASFRRSQMSVQLFAQAEVYRAKARPTVVPMTRSDVADGW